MAEEQFTSRRARREAERLAADQAFEARETPEQPSESSSNGRAELLDPPPAPADEAEPHTNAPEPEPDPSPDEPKPSEPASRVEAEEHLDPQQAPLPHFDARTARKNYLRKHGLSPQGDLSTGAIPVIAGREETAAEDAVDPTAGEDESFDTAGFGGSADEVAARDFESPVTTESAPKPTALDEPPAARDTSAPSAAGPAGTPGAPKAAEAPPAQPNQPDARTADPTQPSAADKAPKDAPESEPIDEGDTKARSRRMPIVAPPSSSGVRVVTAASAQIPEVEGSDGSGAAGTSEASASRPDVAASRPDVASSQGGLSRSDQTAPAADDSPASSAPATDSDGSADAAAGSSDDAARALAANPETRPMETVPEAWALPNPDYEDEETENPPGTRIRASAVTGHDGRILVGEEPSKVPFVVLGVAALFAVALIVIALVMLL